jgi:hypothetical protein
LTEQQFESERRRAAHALAHDGADPMGERQVARRGASPGTRLALPLTVLLMAGCLAAGLILVKRTAPKLHNARIGATRTPVPGSRKVRLDAGKYVIYYEAGITGGIGLARPHGVTVRIETPARRALALHPYAGNFHTGSSFVDARAFLTVQVARSGSYQIMAAGKSSQPIVANAPRVVLGTPTGGNVLRLVGASVMALLAFIALCFALPALWGRLGD